MHAVLQAFAGKQDKILIVKLIYLFIYFLDRFFTVDGSFVLSVKDACDAASEFVQKVKLTC